MFFVVDINAQSNSLLKYQGVISQIQISGLKEIDKGTVYSVIKSKSKQKIFPRIIIEDIKNLYKLGYFIDIKVDAKHDDLNKIQLTFIFQEKPKISKIEYQGNFSISKEDFKENKNLHLYNMLNLSKVKADLQLIRDIYIKNGYFRTKVSYRIRVVSKELVELTYVIEETPKVYLTSIKINGTKRYFPLDIERLLISTKTDCFSWITDGGVFNEEKISADVQKINQHYIKNGYIFVKVDRPKIKIINNPDFSRLEVDFQIEEGNQYFVGDIEIVSEDDKTLIVPKLELAAKVKLIRGEPFNYFEVDRYRLALNDIYQERGYAFSRVRYKDKVNHEKKTVDLKYSILRGEKAYLKRVEIHGNLETRDYVVRRELSIHDNELYNGVKLRDSLLNIQRLGYFASGSAGAQSQRKLYKDSYELDYDITLQESQTGSFNTSLSYSDVAGTALLFSISKNNFMGKGQSVSFSMNFADKGQKEYRFTFSEPYLFDTNFSSNFSVNFDYDPTRSSYNEEEKGFSYALSYPIWKNWRASLRYAFRDIDYTDINENGETALDEITTTVFSSLRAGIKYSTVDNPRSPANGVEYSVYLEQVGGGLLQGNEEFRRYDFNTKYFKSLNQDQTVVFVAKYNAAFLEQSNEDVDIPSTQRFRIGGINTIHGFDYNEIHGPTSPVEFGSGFDLDLYTDASSDYYDASGDLLTERQDEYDFYLQHKGGVIRSVLNIELLFPLTREGGNLRGVVFFDMGNVWSEDEVYEFTDAKKDYSYYRKSVGAGIRVISPLGVLRFEYGVKLDQKRGEDAGRFDFTISGLF